MTSTSSALTSDDKAIPPKWDLADRGVGTLEIPHAAGGAWAFSTYGARVEHVNYQNATAVAGHIAPIFGLGATRRGTGGSFVTGGGGFISSATREWCRFVARRGNQWVWNLVFAMVVGLSPALLQAQPRPFMEGLKILDNHFGDSRDDVTSRLLAMGYQDTGNAFPKCDKDLEPLIQEYAQDRLFKIPLGRLDCTEIFSQGENEFVAQYLLGQRGYVLSSMIYQYETSESAKSAVARFSKLYGQPKSSDEGLFIWFTSSPRQSGRFQFAKMQGISAVSMYSPDVMSDTFYREAEKMVRRAAGQ